MEVKKERKNWLLISMLVCGGILLVWFLTLASFLWLPQLVDVGDRGTFGDMFGGLTSLFSGLAFAGIVISIFMQRDELALTRDTLEAQKTELELTRQTLEGQQAEMSAQSQTMARQQFENTFYQLLAYFNTYLTEMKYERDEGRKIFETIRQNLKGTWRYVRSGQGGRLFEHGKNELAQCDSESLVIKQLFDWFFSGSTEIQPQGSLFPDDKRFLIPYFRILWNVLIYVDGNGQLNETEKAFYTNIVVSQISTSELFFIFYFCLSNEAEEDWKGLVEKYGLLRHFPEDEFLQSSHLTKDNSDHKQLLRDSAYRVPALF